VASISREDCGAGVPPAGWEGGIISHNHRQKLITTVRGGGSSLSG
jgi:hypothetical protein